MYLRDMLRVSGGGFHSVPKYSLQHFVEQKGSESISRWYSSLSALWDGSGTGFFLPQYEHLPSSLTGGSGFKILVAFITSHFR